MGLVAEEMYELTTGQGCLKAQPLGNNHTDMESEVIKP